MRVQLIKTYLSQIYHIYRSSSIMGSIKEFCSNVKTINPHILTTQSFLHKELLISKTLPKSLRLVLDKVVSVVNYIKSKPLKTHMIKYLSNSMKSKYGCLFLYTESRWLPRSKILSGL